MQNLISQLQTLDVRVALILDDRVESRRRFKEKAYRAYPPPPLKFPKIIGYSGIYVYVNKRTNISVNSCHNYLPASH